MANIPNKLVIFGAVAVAALVVPGLVGPLMFDEAYAATEKEQSNSASQTAKDTVVNVQAAVQANVDVQDVNVCVITQDQSCN
jgi:predicted polyphosphate/ATP-dependent NAD kinase